jgi:hypothetical protein
MNRRRLLGFIALAGALALALPGWAMRSAAARPSVWIDQPLPGAELPGGPAAVTVHAAAPAGIATVHLFVDGQPAADLPAPAGALVTVTWTWPSAVPGRHLLTALADGIGGGASEPASVGVNVAGAAEPTAAPAATATMPAAGPTIAPTASPRRSPTPRPSPTLCTPPLPDTITPASFYLVQGATNPPTFEWAYRTTPGCVPAGFRVTIVDSPATGYSVSSGTLAGSARAWTPPAPLPVGRACASFAWTLQVLRANGSVAQSVSRSLAACP